MSEDEKEVRLVGIEELKRRRVGGREGNIQKKEK